jgi:hypothetical protein
MVKLHRIILGQIEELERLLRQRAAIERAIRLKPSRKLRTQRAEIQREVRQQHKALKSLDPYPTMTARQIRKRSLDSAIADIRNNHPEWSQNEIAQSLETRVKKAKAIIKERGPVGMWITTHPDGPLDLEIETSFENLQKVVSKSLKRNNPTPQGRSVETILRTGPPDKRIFQ